MANAENIEPHKWKKGQSGNPKGRPRKWVSTLTDQGYKSSEVHDCILAMMAMTLDELQDAYENENATVLEKTVANAIRRSIKKGSLYSIETLMDRVFGKPKETVNQNMSGRIEQITIEVKRNRDEE
jgi:pyruvate dehydrogenase complex dehydrogenase (E1) component